MRVTRFRFGAVLEWVLAAGCVLLVTGLVSVLTRELRSFKGVTPVLAGGSLPAEPPATLLPRSVSVPMLLLNGGEEIHVGEREGSVGEKVSEAWHIGSDTVEHAEHGERVTRAYDDGGRRFVLVLEPATAGADPRVVAIYLQPR